MDYSIKDTKEELHKLIRKDGGIEEIQSILEKHPSLVNAENKDKNTLLIRAAIFGKVEIVRLLLEKKADTKLQNVAGITALMAAAMEHKVEIIKMLLNAGAAKGAKDEEGKTALDYAEEGESDDKGEVLHLLKVTNRAKLSSAKVSPGKVDAAKTSCHGHGCSIMGGSKRQKRRRSTRRLKLSHKARRI